jgi:hypothetical protein
MNDAIIKAIEDRRLLTFRYKGVERTVEPHTYGCSHKGANGLCAWQLSGGSASGYRLFLEPEMGDIQASDHLFDGPRPGYHAGDDRFMTIYAEL